MKLDRGSVQRLVERPDPAIRFHLFYGPDEARARDLAARLRAGLGDAEKVEMSGASLKGDPGRLSDSAGALSLFGGAQLVWIEPAGDEITEAVEALLALDAVANPVVAIGGALKKTSKLVKLAETHRHAAAFAAYPAEGEELVRMIQQLGQREGLKLSSEIARNLAERIGNNQAVLASELGKYALYLDAQPEAPQPLDEEVLAKLSIDDVDDNSFALPDLALRGQVAELAEALAMLRDGGSHGIPIVRAAQRRLLQAAPAVARVARGERPGDVVTSLARTLYSNDKPVITTMINRFDPAMIAAAHARIAALEKALMSSSAGDAELVGETLLGIARSVAARR